MELGIGGWKTEEISFEVFKHGLEDKVFVRMEQLEVIYEQVGIIGPLMKQHPKKQMNPMMRTKCSH
ncbi:MAG: hypothetical protein R2819_11475 [Allomuricauda sp.]